MSLTRLAVLLGQDAAENQRLLGMLRAGLPHLDLVVGEPGDGPLRLDGPCQGAILAPGARPDAVDRLVADLPRPPRLLAWWPYEWPERLDAFHALYARTGQVLFGDPAYRDRLGRLPGTAALADGFDDQMFRRGPCAATARLLWLLPAAGRDGRRHDKLLLSRERDLHPRGLDADLVEADQAWWADPASRAAAYRRAAVLLCSAPFPGMRQAMLEAAACGCRIVHTDDLAPPPPLAVGGTAVATRREPGAVLEAIVAAVEAGPAPEPSGLAATAWQSRRGELADRIAGGAGDAPRLGPSRDLSDAVTVFVISVGAPSLQACLAHLELQDCRFRLERIDRVAPMSAAFQRMLDTCRTPFCVQVDEDMLLHPEAVGALFDRILAAPRDTALIVAHLWDAHYGGPIQGVKIYRHDVVRRYPYADTMSCELDQLARLRADGFRHRVATAEGVALEAPAEPLVLGLHGTHWTPLSVFERYFSMEQRRQRRPESHRWILPLPGRFLQRFYERNDPIDLYAAMGMIVANVAGPGRAAGEKDFHRYGEIPGFAELQDLLHALERRP